jgi:hypothetical protein
MSTMKMPGFTAEASIYKTNKHYQMAGNMIDAVISGIAPVYSIIPQLMPVDGGLVCRFFGEDLICYEGGGGSPEGPEGPGGGTAASCLSGDGKKLCHCPRNCAASQHACNCY